MRGHRTGSSHSGVEEYPTDKKTKTKPEVVGSKASSGYTDSCGKGSRLTRQSLMHVRALRSTGNTFHTIRTWAFLCSFFVCLVSWLGDGRK